MAENNKLTIPPAFYEYILLYECAQKDWLPNTYNLKLNANGNGDVLNGIKWDTTASYDPRDTGGETKFGITKTTWQSFYDNLNKNGGFPPNYGNRNINSITKDGFFAVLDWFWNTYTHAGDSANFACAFTMCQMGWGGYLPSNINNTIKKLKENADIKDYPYNKNYSSYRAMADATHAFSDPMMAFNILRQCLGARYYNLSSKDDYNMWRTGWMSRSILSLTPYGLYINLAGGNKVGLTYDSSYDAWEAKMQEMVANCDNNKLYIKIFDWGASPESIEKMSSANINFEPSSYNNGYGDGTSSGYSGGGSYSGCGSVSQLGNYSNAPDANIIPQQKQSRDEVLNTLMGGSYTPGDVKTCDELITTDKKKNKKRKSEN